MKVFISWSGSASNAVAVALRGWLKSVIQAVDPWISSEDIEKGARWGYDLARQLADTKFGIICLTPSNLSAPWILFEAGALSKTLDDTYVTPYLLGLEPTAITGPLTQFQAARATKEDTRRLVETINHALGDQQLSEAMLGKGFEKWWPDLQQQLQDVKLDTPVPAAPQRSERDLLEEVLEAVRDIRRDITANRPSDRFLRIFRTSPTSRIALSSEMRDMLTAMSQPEQAAFLKGLQAQANLLTHSSEGNALLSDFFYRRCFSEQEDASDYLNLVNRSEADTGKASADSTAPITGRSPANPSNS